MKIIGLIAEYNPFHNGHKYQIDKIKEMYPDSIIICVCSTCFSQRGEISLLNKWQKTQVALDNGIDIFLELPYFFSTQSADTFAHAALQILNEFKIDTLIFGTETKEMKNLLEAAKIQVGNKEFEKIIKENLSLGINYAAAISNTVEKLINYRIDSPNDILAVSYIKEILVNDYSITPQNIVRTNNYHDKKLNLRIVSASNIREKYFNNCNYKKHLPLGSYNLLKRNKIDYVLYFNIIKYKLILNNSLSDYLDVNEGIDNKLKLEINNSNTLEDLINNVKSKRYTYNKISRMVNHIVLEVLKSDSIKIKNIEYIKILGFNSEGKKYLNLIKKNINYNIIFKHNEKYLTSCYELLATKIYSMITNNKDLVNIEYKKNVIKNF